MKSILWIIIFISIIILCSNLISAEVNSTMEVKVDLVGFNSTSGGEISIEVPDHIDLGEVSKSDPTSNEVAVYINNTGGVDITVVPKLKDEEEEIFKYLFFRKQKSTSTNNTELVAFKQIGDYQLEIDKPKVGKRYEDEHCYMQLNLTNFDGKIREDVSDYSTDLVFIAVPR